MVLKLTNEEMNIIRSALCDKLAKSFVNAMKEAEELENLVGQTRRIFHFMYMTK